MLISSASDLLHRIYMFLRTRAWVAFGSHPDVLHQVAALPMRTSRRGKRKVLLISTRRGGRLIVPRGWPMRGKADFQAAAIEAEEEAGVQGTVTLLPIGSYTYRSGRKAFGRSIRVDVYRLDVTRRLPTFKERSERKLVWLSVGKAARQVGEPGLVPIIESLSASADADDQRAPPAL